MAKNAKEDVSGLSNVILREAHTISLVESPANMKREPTQRQFYIMGLNHDAKSKAHVAVNLATARFGPDTPVYEVLKKIGIAQSNEIKASFPKIAGFFSSHNHTHIPTHLCDAPLSIFLV